MQFFNFFFFAYIGRLDYGAFVLIICVTDIDVYRGQIQANPTHFTFAVGYVNQVKFCRPTCIHPTCIHLCIVGLGLQPSPPNPVAGKLQVGLVSLAYLIKLTSQTWTKAG